MAALAGRPLDYLVPAQLRAEVCVGSIVRVPLHGRRVRGWVVELAGEPATDRRLLPIARVSGIGPSADVLALATWAAWRWAGPVTRFLGTASPPVAVRGLPPAGPKGTTPVRAFRLEVVRLPPADDPFPLVRETVGSGDALVLVPSVAEAAMVAARLRRHGVAVALLPGDWARAAASGCVVVGARAAAWAPCPSLAAAVILDEHDEGYQEERAPTWNARDVVIERARRAAARCVLVSPCPSLDALAMAHEVRLPARADEWAGWPAVQVVDRRQEPPGLGLYSPPLVAALRSAGDEARIVCVLNRKGRSVLLACAVCAELARCERCDGPLESLGDEGLRCRRCGGSQPAVCRWCGAGRFKALRLGVTRVRDELELLAGQPVTEITGDVAPGRSPSAAIVVGTEAVLHRLARAALVAFLDFDQELLAPRYRAADEALALLARAARLVGGREGRILVQTRVPGHEVLDAAVHADPGRLATVEGARRAALRLPPETAVARLSGADASAFVERLAGVDVLGPAGDRWLARAPDHRILCDALARARRPAERVRVEVDPLRA